MLQDENEIQNDFSWWEKTMLNLLTVNDGSNVLRYRNRLAERILTAYFTKRAAKTPQETTTFTLTTAIDYVKEFYGVYKDQDVPWFVINISGETYVDIQIVHAAMMREEAENNSSLIGFAIYLPFDISDEETKQQLHVFQSKSYFPRFIHSMTEDGIDTYFLNCETDFNLLDNIMQQVLVDLKGYQQENRIAVSHFFA